MSPGGISGGKLIGVQTVPLKHPPTGMPTGDPVLYVLWLPLSGPVTWYRYSDPTVFQPDLALLLDKHGASARRDELGWTASHLEMRVTGEARMLPRSLLAAYCQLLDAGQPDLAHELTSVNTML